ncbi:hypothetical protein A2326_00040 [candidate division WWE3 bacterium RIFOXYB2_FULL_41_6]|nr:MAG: hypothetical protein A2326_00040 [candidate division WWE3 bacterium RIFOXYB2_FULL_41_6]OGZ28239.1 MAG: hypothetical protein A2562_00180 [Candidatus Nealsonbacteria bacterium RIFOXYD1_FULL_39_11]
MIELMFRVREPKTNINAGYEYLEDGFWFRKPLDRSGQDQGDYKGVFQFFKGKREKWTGEYDINNKPIFENDIVKRNRRLLKVVWIETPEYIGWKLKLLRNTGIWLESDSIWVDLEVVGDIFEFKRKNAKH